MNLLKSIVFILLFFSCAHYETNSTQQNLEDVYISSGVEQFFLSPAPAWMNFSKNSSCFRNQNIRYLNFENIRDSYNLNYNQILHLQHMFNRKIFAYRTSTGQERLAPKDESFILNNVYQQVLGGSYDFVNPKFKKISLVWIDPFLGNLKKIKELMNRSDVISGHPILVSFCLTSYELEKLAQDAGIEDLGVKYISAEMESIYNLKLEKVPFFSVNIESLLKNKEIYFYGIKKLKTLSSKVKFIKLK